MSHWRDRYEWRETESRLNSYPQFVTTVDGQRIHVIHARSDNPAAVPLLMTHGWPGSVLEFLDVLGPLSTDFHVVTPSLPGFTFSGETSERGWHPRRIAAAFAEVMDRLGYERYGLQGGDWGSLVSARSRGPVPRSGHRSPSQHGDRHSATAWRRVERGRAARREASERWLRTGVGYQEIQGTRPQSLGYALQDSPAGLAAWIVEKFREWSHGDIEVAFTFDRLLDNITSYWVTGTATSSLRIYWEMRQARREAMPIDRIEVPTAIAMFPGEISYPPRAWTEAAFNVVRWSNPVRGGHFAAMEAPEEFCEDVSQFFRQLQAR